MAFVLVQFDLRQYSWKLVRNTTENKFNQKKKTTPKQSKKGNKEKTTCRQLKDSLATRDLIHVSDGFSINLLGGTFFLGEMIFLRSASSLSSLCGLFCGSSWGGSIATAKTHRFEEDLVGFLKWILRGIEEKENVKEMSDGFVK